MNWHANKEEVLKKLIKETIKSIGSIDPNELPHRLKEQLEGQGTGNVDIDALIQDVIDAEKNKL
ncbi:MAG: hypothetical protein AAF720_05330 [Pseudomonadota bacterium]